MTAARHHRVARLARRRPAATSRRTSTSAPLFLGTASRSGTTSGTRAATASSTTASSTTRSRRSSGSGCSRSLRSRSPRSRSPPARREWGPPRAGRAAASRSSGPGSSSPPRSRSRSASRSRCSRSGRCRRGRRWRFAALAMLTLAASPVAFVLLVVVLAGVALARPRRRCARNWVPVAGGRARGSGRAGAPAALPRRRPLPFPARGGRGRASPSACSASRCTWRRRARARAARRLRRLSRSPSSRSYVVPSALGENIARLRYARVPLALLVLALRRWRPLPPGARRRRLAVAWNVSRSRRAAGRAHAADRSANPTTWPRPVALLHAHLGPGYRVEAVDTADHWPALYLADADIPLVRGWFRQDDFPPTSSSTASSARRSTSRWLRALGVAYVVLTDAPPDYSSRARGERSSRAGEPGCGRSSPRTRSRSTRCRGRADRDRAGPAHGSRRSRESRLGVHVHARRRRTASPSAGRRTGTPPPAACARRTDGMLRLQTRAARHGADRLRRRREQPARRVRRHAAALPLPASRLRARARRAACGSRAPTTPPRCGSRVARPRRIAEGDDRPHLAAADLRRRVGVADPVRARDDAVAPRREHHVLRAAAGVEASRSPTIATTSAAERDVLGRVDRLRQAARSPPETTTNSHRCRFRELPERRPASRIRCRTSRGIGVSA